MLGMQPNIASGMFSYGNPKCIPNCHIQGGSLVYLNLCHFLAVTRNGGFQPGYLHYSTMCHTAMWEGLSSTQTIAIPE